MNGADDQRRRELALNLRAVRERLAAACAAARREVDEVTLVAVTKTRPATDVVHLAEMGVCDFGENRDQEASAKAAAVSALLAAGGGGGGDAVAVRWHFVGQLQRNKCRSVVRYADLVHSVDGVRLATALADASRRRAGPLDVLVQVSIDAAVGRGGAVVDAVDEPDADLDRVLQCVRESGSLVLRGLMAIAPLAWEPERAYERLAEIAARVRAVHPAATLLSAGMSNDVEAAIAYGATHVRVGTALLGNRPALM